MHRVSGFFERLRQPDESFDLPTGKEYALLFKKIYGQLTETSMMDKYHNLGTPINVAVLNGIQALPCRNLQRTSDEAISGITGETFAERTLLRNTALDGVMACGMVVLLVAGVFDLSVGSMFSMIGVSRLPTFSK